MGDLDRADRPLRLFSWLARAALVACVGVILLLTLPSGPRAEAPPSMMCIRCGDTPLRDSILNILFFIPFGALVAATGRRGRWAMLSGFMLSFVIEVAQAFIPGRVSSLRDILANGLGAMLGYAVVTHAGTLRAPQPRLARTLGAVALSTAILGLGFTAFALRPHLPGDLYFGQWSPRFAWRPHFKGTLLSASLNGEPLPQGPEAVEGSMRRRMLAGVHLSGVVVPGSPRPGAAPVAAIVDAHRRELATLLLRRDEAIFRSRANASRFGLRTPAVALAGAVRGDTLGRWTLEGSRDAGRLALQSSGPGGEQRRAELALSPGLGWYLFLPTPTGAGPETPWFSALWIALCFAPAAWWLSRVGGWIPALVLALGMAVALEGVPRWVQVAPAPWWEWLGALAGCGIAWTAARRQLPRVTPRT